MKRTQIQIPDHTYNKLKELAAKEEISFTEIIRRAAEYLLCLYPEYDEAENNWQPPNPVDLGPFRVDDSDWKMISNDDEDISDKRSGIQ